MRSFIYLAVSAFAALAAAQSGDNAFNVPSGGYDFTAGEPTTLTWDPTTSGTVTLKLQVGTDVTPESGEVIASNIPNSGSFSFVPPNTADPNVDYTVEIIDDNNPDNYNFTPTFNVENPSFSGTTTSAAPTTTAEVSTTTEESTATTETDSETTTTDASTSGTTMATSSSASGTATTTSSDSESTSGTTTAEPTVQTTTAPGAGSSLKVQGGMFALVAGVMAAL